VPVDQGHVRDDSLVLEQFQGVLTVDGFEDLKTHRSDE
jgi:hypothetical protein